MSSSEHRRAKIVFFGHFGAGNFGNEATFQAMLFNVRRLVPSAELLCVTTFPEKVAKDYAVAAISANEAIVKPWTTRNPLVKLARKLFVGIPSEVYRWFKAIATLWRSNMLVVVGTGLLTDSFGLESWGPYSVFKWSLTAKLCGCKLFFVSAGAGPLDRLAGRVLVKSALLLADFLSFRDSATLEYLRRIGFSRKARLCPDLAFSLPVDLLPKGDRQAQPRPVVGIGFMDFCALYGTEKTTRSQYSSYIETLVEFTEWVIARGYDTRLLIGDVADESTVADFKRILSERSVPMSRVVSEPITSSEALLVQIAAVDFAVVTRFHNIVLSLLLNKPPISISFHHKCASLMSEMGLSLYCQNIQTLSGPHLVQQFRSIEKNAQEIKRSIKARTAIYREVLSEQYDLILHALPEFTNEEINRISQQAFTAPAPKRDRS